DYNGYWLPTAYDNHGAVDEYWACRERAAIMDLSPLRKWEVLGPDAEELLQSTMTRDIRRLSDGQVVYTALCNDTGGMIDDGTVFRLHATNFRFVGGSDYDGVGLRLLGRAGVRVLLPPQGCGGALGCGARGRRTARARAARARGARHAAHRGRPHLRRLRVRRPGRPVRGRHRLHRACEEGGRF